MLTEAHLDVGPPEEDHVRHSPLEMEWIDYLSPVWKTVSLAASLASLDMFSRRIASVGLRPSDLEDRCVMSLAYNVSISVEDAGALRVALRCHQRRAYTPPDSAVAARSQDALTHGGAATLRDLAPPAAASEKISDISYANRPLVSVDRRTGKVDFMETLVCSAGPGETIGVEQTIHSLLTIPEAILLSTSLAEIVRVLDADPAPADGVSGVVTAYWTVRLVSFYLNSFIFMHSLANIAVCVFAKLTDRSAAHYLTLPFMIRFADMIGVFILVVLLEPLALVLLSVARGSVFMVVLVAVMSAVFIAWTSVAMLFLGGRERSAFNPFPDHLRDESSGYFMYEDRWSHDTSSTGSPPDCGRVACARRWIARKADKYFFMHDNEREIALLGFIGRWRKWMLSLRFRESLLDYFADDECSAPARASAGPRRQPPEEYRPTPANPALAS